MVARTEQIYALVDPRTGLVRYVGHTSRGIEHRRADHVRQTRYAMSGKGRFRGHCHVWIAQLLTLGLEPRVSLVANVDSFGWAAAEAMWIEFYRRCGAALTNQAPGGEGRSGPRPASTRLKIGNAHRGKTISPEARAKMSAAKLGRTLTAEHRAKIGAANTGNPRVGAKWRGKSLSASHRANIGAGLRGNRNAVRPDIQCGTRSGYQRHLRLQEPTCQLCRDAAAAIQRQRRRAR